MEEGRGWRRGGDGGGEGMEEGRGWRRGGDGGGEGMEERVGSTIFRIKITRSSNISLLINYFRGIGRIR